MSSIEGVVVLTTVGSRDDAQRIARELVERRLAACVNLLPIDSIYRWEGKISEEPEVLLLIKTLRRKVEELREGLLRIHPYEVPEFVVLPMESASHSYYQWILESTAPLS